MRAPVISSRSSGSWPKNVVGWAVSAVNDRHLTIAAFLSNQHAVEYLPIDYAKRFLKIVGGGESRIRQVFGPEDGAPR